MTQSSIVSCDFLTRRFKVLSDNQQEKRDNHQKHDDRPSRIPFSSFLGLRKRFRKSQYRPQYKELEASSGKRKSPKWIGDYQHNDGGLNLIEYDKNDNRLHKIKDSFRYWAHSLSFTSKTVDFQKNICQESRKGKHDKNRVKIREPINQRIDKIGREGVHLMLFGIIFASLIAPFNLHLAGYAGVCFLSGGLGMRLAAYDLSSL